MRVTRINLSRQALKDLKKVPHHVSFKLQTWMNMISEEGYQETVKIPSYHDEPLKGVRKGQRSIRLSKAYRAIYIIDKTGDIKIIDVLEVNKHDY